MEERRGGEARVASFPGLSREGEGLCLSLERPGNKQGL